MTRIGAPRFWHGAISRRSAWPATLEIALAGLIVLGLHTPGRAAEEDAALRGKALVETNCAPCHAVDEKSKSPHQDAPPFRTLASRWPLEYLEEALAEGIITGHPDMPAFVFEPPEIDAIIEYLYSLNPGEKGVRRKE